MGLGVWLPAMVKCGGTGDCWGWVVAIEGEAGRAPFDGGGSHPKHASIKNYISYDSYIVCSPAERETAQETHTYQDRTRLTALWPLV